ncbi:MAG: type II secretion system protein [Phycisphaerae bacterium]|nr:type II secretion system protein [Phycisphaerae bacterium]
MRSGTTCPRRAGFTLVELLVVMAILMILGGILLPWITKAVQFGTSVGSAAFLSSAAQATWVFHKEEGYFPGQKDPGQLKGSGGTYTGSQWLAARLFGYPDGDISSNSPKATSAYLEYKAHLLLPSSNPVTDGRNNSLADASKNPHPLLYWPSRLGGTTAEQCYKWDDNSEYILSDLAWETWKAAMWSTSQGSSLYSKAGMSKSTYMHSYNDNGMRAYFYGNSRLNRGYNSYHENVYYTSHSWADDSRYGTEDFVARNGTIDGPANFPWRINPPYWSTPPGPLPPGPQSQLTGTHLAKLPGEFLLLGTGSDDAYFTFDDDKSWAGH